MHVAAFRINIEVLSVVAQQITSILNAMKVLQDDFKNSIRAKVNMSEDDAFATVDKRLLTKKFTFQGQDIDLVWSCGLFITMNPGLCHACRDRRSHLRLLALQVTPVERSCPTT